MPASPKKRSKYARRPYQPGDELNAIGPTLRRIRCAREWSQTQMAIKCQLHGWDVDRVIVAKLESGIRSVSDWELLKLCQILSVTPDELLGVSPLPKNAGELLAHLKSKKRVLRFFA
jgi:transcriptional regulator with XRE-family HTH domain